MPRNRWPYYVALGGCLLGAFLICAPVLAQQSNEKTGAPITPEDANLAVQESMAKSTAQMVGWTERQFWVGSAGIVLLVVTVFLTFRATHAAIEANKIARETAKRQLRAYLGVANGTIRRTDLGEGPVVILAIKNFGQTPARDVQHVMYCGSCPVGNEEKFFTLPFLEHTPEIDLGAGQALFPRYFVGSLEWSMLRDKVTSKTATFYVWGEILYRDVFGDSHRTQYRLSVGVKDADSIENDLGIVAEGNKSD